LHLVIVIRISVRIKRFIEVVGETVRG